MLPARASFRFFVEYFAIDAIAVFSIALAQVFLYGLLCVGFFTSMPLLRRPAAFLLRRPAAAATTPAAAPVAVPAPDLVAWAEQLDLGPEHDFDDGRNSSLCMRSLAQPFVRIIAHKRTHTHTRSHSTRCNFLPYRGTNF